MIYPRDFAIFIRSQIDTDFKQTPETMWLKSNIMLFRIWIHRCKQVENLDYVLGMDSANERRRYNLTPSLIGLAHIQKTPLFVIKRRNTKIPSILERTMFISR